jgi:hypothetical protein
MNFLKLFGRFTKQQKTLLNADKEKVLSKCNVIANSEWEDQKESKEVHDNVCPKCHARKEFIVDNYCYVTGNANTRGSFTFGFGNVNSTLSIVTLPVNHCKKCANEWTKFKVKYVCKTDIVRVGLRYLSEMMIDPSCTTCWKEEVLKVFDDCYAETIYKLYKENKVYISKPISLSELRKHYKSIYNQ